MSENPAAWQQWHARVQSGVPKILVIQRDNIGDLVLSTPFLRALRDALPEARIDVLSNSYNAPVLTGNTAINAAHVYTKLKHRAHGESRLKILWNTLRLRWTLRREAYDLAIVMGARLSAHGLALARAVRPAQIAAFVRPADGVPAGVDLAVDPDQGSLHAPLLHHRLLARLLPAGHALPPQLPPCEVAVDQGLRESLSYLREHAQGAPILALHVSARKVDQRWPAERFAELAHAAHAKFGAHLLLLWAPGQADNPLHPGDDEKAEEIRALCADLPVSAQPTQRLEELIAALSYASCVVLSDGGAMHLAAALQRPMVCMFGNSDPKQWAPWRTHHVLLRHPSTKVEALGVAEVTSALERLVAQYPQAMRVS